VTELHQAAERAEAAELAGAAEWHQAAAQAKAPEWHQAAERAQTAAGVQVRPLSAVAEMVQAAEVLGGIWGQGGHLPLTPELLRALAATENYVAGAFDADTLVGVLVGFHSMADFGELHSHIAGVSAARAGRSIGFALKQHQRAWAIDRGIAVIEWTFDPLVARNAHFNLVKLGADATRYLPDFYGPMTDAINAGDSTDRLLVRWRLTAPQAVAAARGDRRVLPAGPGLTHIPIPPDIEALRRTDPGAARAWRERVAEALAPALARGHRIVGFDSARGYAVAGPAEPPADPPGG
jgi:predicted GNAT superfamily acetyltransferase